MKQGDRVDHRTIAARSRSSAARGGLRLAALLSLVVLTGLALVACVTPESKVCADGLICPPNSQCDDVNHRCLGASYCGDGERTESEVCEGDDLGAETCQSLGFYGQTTGLKCAADCKFDKSGCSGRCGDGLINGPDEQCDGAPPSGKTCLDYGYDSGFLGCSELCQPSVAGCDKGGWEVVVSVPEPTGYEPPFGYNAIWGSSSQDVFAVGSDIIHWDGAAWSTMEAPPVPSPDWGARWVGVWGSGPDDVWTVGGNEILHWDGATWSTASVMWTSPLVQELWVFGGVWGTGPNDVYAFGGWMSEPPPDLLAERFVLHWDGANWSHVPLPTPTDPLSFEGRDPLGVTSMGGSGPNDIYALTWEGEALHFDGTSWSHIIIADHPCQFIWASAANDVYAACAPTVPGGPTGAYHWDGSSWVSLLPTLPTLPTLPGASGDPEHPGPVLDTFSSVWGSGPNDVFLGTLSTIIHWDGATWSRIYEGGPDWGRGGWGDGALESTWFLVDDQIMQLSSRGLWHALPAAPELIGISALWGTGEDVFALANFGGAFGRFRKGSAFGALPPAPITCCSGLSSLWGSAVDDIWASGFDNSSTAGVWHWNGSSWAPTNAVDYAGWPVLGGSGSSDVWAVGGSGSATHWNGQAWSEPFDLGSSGAYFSSIWSRSSTEAFAVGSSGAIIRWDGTAWSPMTSGTTEDLNDVWGSGRDVFAVGNDGTILRLEDGTWTAMVSGTSNDLYRIRSSSEGNVFVTAGDRLLHLRAGAWEPVAIQGQSPTAEDAALVDVLGPLWVTPTSVYVAGSRLDLVGVNCQSPEGNCTDGWDNDCDGFQDGADPDCAGQIVEQQCANLADDDGDGLSDCADPDCATFSRCRQP